MKRRWLLVAFVLAAIGACTRSVVLTPQADAGSDGGGLGFDGGSGFGSDGGSGLGSDGGSLDANFAD